MIYLITGKAGAGKTHYATQLIQELIEEGRLVKHIDGDQWRLDHKNDDYSDQGRLWNLKSAAEYARSFEKKGYIVVMSFIAPRRQWRDEMRKLWQKSRVIYIPGGKLWEGTTYEKPTEEELL
jgi:adenylylsulfate kinase-like enzyme